MKKLFIITFLLSLLALGYNTADARISSVRGYIKKSGTYVTPHYKTSSNSTRLDNWSTKGNSNPFTGKKGYAKPFKY